MTPEATSQVLDVLYQCKREAMTPRAKAYFDRLAIGLITQEAEPMKMAAGLKHLFDLEMTRTNP